MPDARIPFLPEGVINPALPQKPWTTLETTPIEAKVNLNDCIAMLPRNVNAYTDLIHWHELGHVRYTESLSGIFGKTEPGVWDHILREPQVNILLLRQVRIDVAQAMRAFDFDEHPIPLLPRNAGILWINLAYYLKDRGNANLLAFAGRLEAKIREGWEGDRAFNTCFDAVQAVIKEPTALARQTWAVKLAEYFNPPPPPPVLEGELTGETEEAIDEADKEAEEAERREADKLKDDVLTQVGRGSRIDNMEIHEHITLTRPGSRIAVPGGARDTGIMPRRFDRFCLDKKIFKIRKTGGSLVIDCSGSMHWDWEALKTGLKAFPNVTVACYAGFHDDINGRLCVIAKKGRWSDYEPFKEPGGLSGNNTVDYQALLWLASQPKPRLWLSDGQICGGNRNNTYLNCDDLLRKSQTYRVETLEAALKFFGRKEVPAFTKCHGAPVLARRK